MLQDVFGLTQNNKKGREERPQMHSPFRDSMRIGGPKGVQIAFGEEMFAIYGLKLRARKPRSDGCGVERATCSSSGIPMHDDQLRAVVTVM